MNDGTHTIIIQYNTNPSAATSNDATHTHTHTHNHTHNHKYFTCNILWCRLPLSPPLVVRVCRNRHLFTQLPHFLVEVDGLQQQHVPERETSGRRAAGRANGQCDGDWSGHNNNWCRRQVAGLTHASSCSSWSFLITAASSSFSMILHRLDTMVKMVWRGKR